MIPDEANAIEAAIEFLCRWIGCRPDEDGHLEVVRQVDSAGSVDAVLEHDETHFLLEYKRSGQISAVAGGIRQLEAADNFLGDVVKILVVPYMPDPGRERCQQAGISWIDLSGNADVTGPGIRIYVQGEPNRFKRPGRPTNVFAPKSSRVARVLLYNRGSAFKQRELSKLTGLGEGYVSRIVRSLEGQELLRRVEDGKVVAGDTSLLLDAWLESYNILKHTIYKGHTPARSGSALQQELSETLSRKGIKHAATGLGAAWQYTHFAAFRTASVFIGEALNRRALSDLDFRETETGANTWLIVPNDESVFWRADEIDGVRCVHPIQAYLDLKGHPERAYEAMGELRRLILESAT